MSVLVFLKKKQKKKTKKKTNTYLKLSTFSIKTATLKRPVVPKVVSIAKFYVYCIQPSL